MVDGAQANVNVRSVKAVTTHSLRWDLTHIAHEIKAGKRAVVTFRGRPVFGLVPLKDLEELEGKPVEARPAKRRPK